jgi:hypothetical protein
MDDLTPWVYWGVGPARAWQEALDTGLINHVAYFREPLTRDNLTRDDLADTRQSQAPRPSNLARLLHIHRDRQPPQADGLEHNWVEMSPEEYQSLVEYFLARRQTFQGSDEEMEVIKIWALGRYAAKACGEEEEGEERKKEYEEEVDAASKAKERSEAPCLCRACVLMLLYVSSYCYMCPHTTIYVSSYLYVCPDTTTCVLTLVCVNVRLQVRAVSVRG